MIWQGNALDKAVVEQHFIPAVDAFRNQLVNPQNTFCQIVKYAIAQSVLLVRVHNPDTSEAHTLLFGSVIYFDGPMNWRDASLFVRPYDEAVRFYNRVNEKQQGIHMDEDNFVCLYQFGVDEPIATILAWDFHVDKLINK